MSKPGETYHTVLRLLPTLTSTEREQVIHACKALGALPNNTRGAQEGDEPGMVLKCLCHHLHKRGVDFAQPAVLKRMGVYSTFKNKVPALMQFLTHQGITMRTQQWVVLEMGFGYLYDNLIALDLPCDASMMMKHIHRVPALINREFPGYAEAGYLALVTTTSKNLLDKTAEGA